ncbi:MAG TPA: VCBS repeat-containing protein [Caldilineaceae bacterium]|nr:VCBS repeat-containing protein [Caldilineaceae bacterium]
MLLILGANSAKATVPAEQASSHNTDATRPAELNVPTGYDRITHPRYGPLQQSSTPTISLETTGQWSALHGAPLGIAWGDYDNDGYLDLAVADAGQYRWDKPCSELQSGFVAIYHNQQGVLEPQPIWRSARSEPSTSVAWGDIDRDGDLDLAVGNFGLPNRIYKNENGTFSEVWNDEQPEPTSTVAWVDINNDGYLELSIGNGWKINRDRPCDPGASGAQLQNKIYGNVQGLLQKSPVWTDGKSENTRALAWGDMNNDGWLDLAVGNYGAADHIYLNHQGDLDTAPVAGFTGTGSTLDLAWGDMNNDQVPELAIIGENGSGPLIFSNSCTSANAVSCGIGTSYLGLILPEGLHYGWNVNWGDVNGDGYLDLFAGTSEDGHPQIFLNQDGQLNTMSAWSFLDTVRVFDSAWGDVDGNGTLDLAMVDSGGRVVLLQNHTIQLETVGIKIASNNPTNIPSGLAWGDVDGNGFLDLAAGSRIWINQGGSLSASYPYNNTAGNIAPTSVAWGDVDGDGDLDLAAGYYGQPAKVFANNGERITGELWHSNAFSRTTSISWGDIDGDGDLDLAIGNYGQPNEIYQNINGTLQADPFWRDGLTDMTTSLAWGDIDNDGDLDLAVGNGNFGVAVTAPGSPNKLYENVNGTFHEIWSDQINDSTTSVAWGDFNRDGWLDLAVGNYGQPNRLYENHNGTLTTLPAWSSVDADFTTSLAWGDLDNDGDLDLAAANAGGAEGRAIDADKIYGNNGDRFLSDPKYLWLAQNNQNSYNVAWGDIDNDGDLELAFAGQELRIHDNQTISRTRPSTNLLPRIKVEHTSDPVPTFADSHTATLLAPANGYATSWIRESGIIPIRYTLFHPTAVPVAQIRAYYSLNGGGDWREAVATNGTITTSLATCADENLPSLGCQYVYQWDIFGSKFFGQSDNVLFRLVASPDLKPQPNGAAGPYQWGAPAVQTFPFRVRGAQVQVIAENASITTVKDAIVYRLPISKTSNALPIGGIATPFHTDRQGYLQGRGTIALNDTLIALLPASLPPTITTRYSGSLRLYYTNAAPKGDELDAYRVYKPGQQQLKVAISRPLLLFDLTVSLEWDARKDDQFTNQLSSDLQRTSELLYDWTNGQAALGNITIYHDQAHWDSADIRIYATNRLRPNASVGGIVSSIVTETVAQRNEMLGYLPGQVHIGASWNRFGESNGTIGEDWPRALAHELGHYLFFLQDDYLGLDEKQQLIPIDSCFGSAMTNPYRNDHSEFLAEPQWQERCGHTLAAQTTMRGDWKTIQKFYSWSGLSVSAPPPIANGPMNLPMAVTTVHFEPQEAAPDALLATPFFYLSQETVGRTQTGPTARVILFHEGRLVDLGASVGDQIYARGASKDDRLCVFEPDAERYGCITIAEENENLPLTVDNMWKPDLIVSPVTTRTVVISVTNFTSAIAAEKLSAALYSAKLATYVPVGLAADGATYSATFDLPTPITEGYIHLCKGSTDYNECVRHVENPSSIVSYVLGGAPVPSLGGEQVPSLGSEQVRIVGREDAPVISGDGRVILFGLDLKFPLGEFYSIQSTTILPSPPPWTTVVGQAYRLLASSHAPASNESSISFTYLGREVPSGEEDFLQIYYWADNEWQPLPTKLNTSFNIASTTSKGPGLYALMTAYPIPLSNRGWNNFAYPVHMTNPVTVALNSIAGSYSIVWGYDAAHPADPWRGFDPTVPSSYGAVANELTGFEFGKGYWIHITATDAITLYLKGAEQVQSASVGLTPPALFYGEVPLTESFTPTAGMPVEARMDNLTGKRCAQGTTVERNGQIIFALKVPAEDGGDKAGCGATGRMVQIMVNGISIGEPKMWDNTKATGLFQLEQRLFLPIVNR